MAKEMVVSANPHETRVAILEDGLVSEVFYEREKSYSLAGSIYKGRVTRILPGMQSAFVNIGLERDAFLYVSDFLEGLEEYDQLMNSLEERTPPRGSRAEEPESGGDGGVQDPVAAKPVAEAEPSETFSPAGGKKVAEAPEGFPPSVGIEPLPGELISAPPRPALPQGERDREAGKGRDGGRGGRFGRRGRRGGQRARSGFPDSKYARGGTEQPIRPLQEETPAVVPEAASPEGPVERILLPGESLAKYKDWARPTESHPDLAPHHETPLEIARDNKVMEAVHEEEIEEMAAAVVEVAETEMSPAAQAVELTAPMAKAPVTSAEPSEPVEQEADEVLITPHTFAPPVFDPEAFESSTASSMTAEDLADLSEATLNEIKADSAEEGIEWEAREGVGDSSEAAANEEGSEQMSAEAGESEEGSSEDSTAASGSAPAEGEPRDAAVREGGRNPRLQRRQRWQSRRGGARREGGARRDQGRRPQRGGEKDAPREAQRNTPRALIGDMLKEGQEIIVQIAKEPLGKKGARITSHIALPGRYVVYMPTLNHVGVSRKVSSDEERQRLKRIVLDAAKNFAGGFIVRTAGDGHSEEDVRQDVQYLTKLWLDIKAKAEKSSAPSLLHHDPDLVLRTLRDQLSPEFTTIWVDNEQVYEQILLMVQKFQPALVGRVRLYSKEVPLFEETGVQEEINKALKPKVWLKSGGYIVINQTEALVAIDVNTGKFVGKSNRLEDTIVKTNIEAIQEIVRQIRLRDLGGIIIIDFIDMDERKNRAKVMAELEEAVKVDRSPSKILSFNEFGLVAITRKRVRQSLERAVCQPCAYCSGSGMVKSPATVSLEILSEAKKQAPELVGRQVTIRVNPEVGKTLKSTASSIIDTIEEMTGKGVIIRNDPSVHMENFYFD